MLAGSAAAAKPAASVRPGDVVTAVRVAAAYGVVTSTYRSPAHNRAVGGVPNSYHLYGRAIDIARRPGVTHRQIEAALRAAGYSLVESLDEGDHSHFAFGPALASPVGAPLEVVGRRSPPVPAAPAPPRLLADEHGVLLVDLQASAGSAASGEADAAPQAGGSAP